MDFAVRVAINNTKLACPIVRVVDVDVIAGKFRCARFEAAKYSLMSTATTIVVLAGVPVWLIFRELR